MLHLHFSSAKKLKQTYQFLVIINPHLFTLMYKSYQFLLDQRVIIFYLNFRYVTLLNLYHMKFNLIHKIFKNDKSIFNLINQIIFFYVLFSILFYRIQLKQYDREEYYLIHIKQ